MANAFVRSGRLHLFTVLMVAGFAAVGVRLFYLQIVDAERIAEREVPSRLRMEPLAAKRGEILDRHGNLLAGTRSRVQVGMDPTVVDVAASPEWLELATILEVPFADVELAGQRRQRMDGQGNARLIRWVALAEVDEERYSRVMALGLRGVYGNRRYERMYPARHMAGQVIGYLNREGTPVCGVEEAMDFYLRGQQGWREVAVDGMRRELAAFREREVEPRNGEPVRLTLDLVAQSIVEAALARAVAALNPDSVVVIVSKPCSGEILALANYPHFDPNTFWEFPLETQRNRALSDQFEPGSTFKIVPVAAALEERLMGLESMIDCSQTHRVYNGVNIPLPDDHRAMGQVTLRTAVQKSSNRAAALIGIELGRQRLYDYARGFGFGERVEWPLRGAASGSLSAPGRWDGYAISRVPTGYAVAVTPMQLHLAMAAVANDGEYVAPRLIIETASGIPFGRNERRRVVAESTAVQLKELLLAAVEGEGTGARAAIPGYHVAGKTGTARKLVNGRYSNRNHLASFSGFFPAASPAVVITVMIDNPQLSGAGYGGALAAPVFREIGERLIPHLSIRLPDEPVRVAIATDYLP